MDDLYTDLKYVVWREGDEKIILIADPNAWVGRSNPNFTNLIGTFGEKMEANGNGKGLLNLLKLKKTIQCTLLETFLV